MTTDEILSVSFVTENLKKQKYSEIIVNGKKVQTEEISDDGFISITKTNPNGL